VSGEEETRVAWEDFVKFVRQLSHDLRNQLNAIELQGALVAELSSDPELKPEIQRLRELISQTGTTLQQLSVSVGPPQPTRLQYEVAEFMDDLQQKIARTFPEEADKIKWQQPSGDATLEIDPTLIEAAVVELFSNAVRDQRRAGQIEVSAEVRGSEFVFSLREPKREAIKDTAAWSAPLRHVSHGHYGLGRRRVRAILQAHGGRLETCFESSAVINLIMLPCSNARR
jgi:K+-sensing histidine kinase KdpD